ncbi:Alcohol acetyltransferase [Fusarium torreyae]|uniref:Alcohol acetyltransferase n=1 Tax=Fusarium torreyae TaxID=1237075 RepID=A0A9W8S9W9_9HYPO|nr:Alcohol acetyltransferase [Fusarium torreyae]
MSTNSRLPLRRLGRNEKYQSGLHYAGHYRSTVVTCRYILPPSLAQFDRHKDVVQRFDAAVSLAVVQFPLLQVGLVGESTNKPVWVSLASLDLNDHIKWDVQADSNDYDRLLEDNLRCQLDTKFDHLETQPGWRLLMMRTETGNFVDVMFVWNHANCDGMSARMFHRALLKSLNSPSSSTPLAPGSRVMSTAISKNMFPQPQEKLAKHPLTLGFLCSEMWHGYGPSILLSSTAKANWAPVQPKPYKTHIKCMDIDPVTLKRLIGLCRKHETTLTGLLHGIMLVCLSTQLPEGKANAFTSSTPVDQRRFMRHESRPSKHASLDPQNSVQNCVAPVHHTFDCKIVSDIRAQARASKSLQPIHDLEPSIWEAAKTVRNDIEERLSTGLTNNLVGLMKLVPDWHEFHKNQEKKSRGTSWTVTNIGVVDDHPDADATKVREEDAWSVARTRFTLSADVAGSAIQMSAVSVKGGDLSIEISWQDLIEINEVCDQLVPDLEAWLRHLGI